MTRLVVDTGPVEVGIRTQVRKSREKSYPCTGATSIQFEIHSSFEAHVFKI